VATETPQGCASTTESSAEGGGNNAWWVYIARCADNTLYTGIAKDCAARVLDHNAGRGAKYTRSRRPIALVYSEPASDRSAAQKREHEIKQMRSERKKALIGG
jgi:putative endonuclease